MTWQIRKRFPFEAAHRLTRAYSKCCTEQIHGHSYVCDVFLESQTLNNDGMVIDFGLVTARIGDYMKSWDHCLILFCPVFPTETAESSSIIKYNKNVKFVKYNPTAENMAKDMFEHIKKLLVFEEDNRVKLKKVRIHETSTGWAEFFEE